MSNTRLEKKILEYIQDTSKTSPSSDFYSEEEAATRKDLEKIESKVKIHSWIIVGSFVAILVAFCGFVFSTICFHINANEYFRDIYELDKSFNQFENQNYIKSREILEIKQENQKMLDIANCLESKKYWQYEECFK